MPTMKEGLLEVRVVAERLALGDAEARKLRGLVVDFIDVLLGKVPNHPDVNNSGARYAPNDPGLQSAQHAVSQRMTGAALAPPSPGIEQPRDVVAIGTERIGPHGPWVWNGMTWEPKAAAAVAAPADPAGPDAMAALTAELLEQEKKTNGTNTTQPGGQ